MANRLRRCHECGFPLGTKDVFCPRCGARQRRDKIVDRHRGAYRCYVALKEG
jgi:uncharacterized Zn finger protein (UPF0148 family)